MKSDIAIIVGLSARRGGHVAALPPLKRPLCGPVPIPGGENYRIVIRVALTGFWAPLSRRMLADAGRRGDGRWARGSVPGANPEFGNTWGNAMTTAGAVIDHAPADGP